MSGANETRVDQLKVEYRSNPIGLDHANPRFSWTMVSQERGQVQTAYQILVATRKELLCPETADVWNSGRIRSGQSTAIRYGGGALLPSTRYYWSTMVWDKNNILIESTGEHYFETGLMSRDGLTNWDGAKWIAMENKPCNSPGAPMLRMCTKLSGKVKAARLYITSLGVYKAYLNGAALGIPDENGSLVYELLTPGWSNYDTTVHYMTYDVTGYLEKHDYVTVGVILGNGWYNGRISRGSPYYCAEGNDLALLAKLMITFEDHSTRVIVTDTESGWKSTDNGPVRENDIYDGETYDATREMAGWDKEAFDDSNWNRVKEHDFTMKFPNLRVTSYRGNTARILDDLDQAPKDGPPSVHSGKPAVYDLGQNMVGVPRITVKGKAGTQIRLRFGEMLNDDSKGADGPPGTVYFANLRTAKQTCLYTLKGSANGEIYQPSLTFFGFRYVEITVITEGSSIEVLELTGKVASSMTRQLGSIETSDRDINKLFSNILWGHRGNYLWVPTDCPQRDERLGWTGDTQLFANTALYNGDCIPFLESFMDTLVDSQEIYGYDQASFTSTAPGCKHANFNSFALEGKGPVGQSGWADIGIILPWTVWQMTGDSTIIEEHYDSMVNYMSWMYSITGETYKGPGSIGDWLGLQGTGNQFMSDVYYAYDALLMSAMAGALRRVEDAARYGLLYRKIKAAFITRYISRDQHGALLVKSSILENPDDLFEDGIAVYRSVKEDNTQTALLWCLKLGLYEDAGQRQELIELLGENIKNTPAFKAAHPDSTRVHYGEYTLSIGFLGVNIIAPVLTDCGLSELAYALLLQEEMPSWLYSVKNGATTVWERWNSYSVETGFGNVGMNSFNHYSYGAIAEWMYQYMAGIANDPDVPGFKHILLKPTPDKHKRITKVKGSFESVYGTIVSHWEWEKDVFTYEVVVPANTTATIYVPAEAESDIRADGLLKPVKVADGRAVYQVGSGRYTFESILR